ncbi:hypothetical protein [Cellulosimicrobium sp. I38E]|uniref:hypothetical protein n=1 Tax=Cellulosimicrobium sp. I38E TaxID=1393139 RepID=UPI000A5FB771|nr:hypothetical protein [Cellulosimicrobium sp. I38E]
MTPRTRRRAARLVRRVAAAAAVAAAALALGVALAVAIVHVFVLEPLRVLAHLIGATS